MIVRRLFVLGFVAALITAFGCSSGGGSGGGGTPPAIVCADGGPAGADTVALTCGGATDSTTEQVDVVMGGPAAGTTTLRGLNFDVTYDPSKLLFVPGSTASPLFPNALIVVSLFNGQPGRVVVSIQQPGTSADVSVVPGQHLGLSLIFRRATGATFTPTPLAFENMEATNASTAIGFASSLTLAF